MYNMQDRHGGRLSEQLRRQCDKAVPMQVGQEWSGGGKQMRSKCVTHFNPMMVP